MRPGVTPFEYYWQSHGELLDAFVRESGDYRKAVDGGDSPVPR
jgi:penicillin-binding protein 1A